MLRKKSHCQTASAVPVVLRKSSLSWQVEKVKMSFCWPDRYKTRAEAQNRSSLTSALNGGDWSASHFVHGSYFVEQVMNFRVTLDKLVSWTCKR